jgi:hypothetical protein
MSSQLVLWFFAPGIHDMIQKIQIDSGADIADLAQTICKLYLELGSPGRLWLYKVSNVLSASGCGEFKFFLQPTGIKLQDIKDDPHNHVDCNSLGGFQILKTIKTVATYFSPPAQDELHLVVYVSDSILGVFCSPS